MTARRRRQTWWRRERLAVLLLPVVLAAAVLATSSRIEDYWWRPGFHEQYVRGAGGVVHVDDEYDDGFVSYPIRADVSLVSAEPVTELPGAVEPPDLPTGARLWEVRLAWRADPDIALGSCAMALVDDDGNRYDAGTGSFRANTTTPVEKCVPDDTPGPEQVIGSRRQPTVAAGQAPRPERWQTVGYVLTPDTARPTAVRLWWVLPGYAELPLG